MDSIQVTFKPIVFLCCVSFKMKYPEKRTYTLTTTLKCHHLTSLLSLTQNCLLIFYSNSGGRSLNQALEDQAFGVVPGAYQSSHHHTSSSSNHNTIHRRQSAGAAAAAAAAAAATAGEGRTAASTAISPAASHGSATSSLRIRYIFTSFFPRKNYAKLSKE